MILVNTWKTVVLERYAKFDGRAGRAEFWWFFLANLIISVVFNILGQASFIFSIVGLVYSLGVLVPSIAVAIRRLHDIDKSGWFLLIGLIPIVGWIILIVFYAKEGDAGTNTYGAPDPGIPAA
jgi:uncharacterized membrane protein YhaH (DUF805 family)